MSNVEIRSCARRPQFESAECSHMQAVCAADSGFYTNKVAIVPPRPRPDEIRGCSLIRGRLGFCAVSGG